MVLVPSKGSRLPSSIFVTAAGCVPMFTRPELIADRSGFLCIGISWVVKRTLVRRTMVVLMLGAVALASTCARADAAPQLQQGQSRTADSCGRADPSYLRVANETGGHPLFLKPS